MGALDTSVLTRLAADVNDRAFVASFAQKYRTLLERRVERLTTAITTADVDASMEAALSLKVSSRTVGTQELAALADQIEDDVRRRDLVAAEDRLVGLPAAAERADRALEAYLSLVGG